MDAGGSQSWEESVCCYATVVSTVSSHQDVPFPAPVGTPAGEREEEVEGGGGVSWGIYYIVTANKLMTHLFFTSQ